MLLLALLAACGSTEVRPTITVGTASSLVDAVTELASAYNLADVQISAAGSQVIAAQVREGAPLDVVIAADERTARALADAGLLRTKPERFAGNRLAIAVAEGNPLAIAGLGDLTGDRFTVLLAAPEVPAGAYTAQLLENAGLELSPASREPSVRSVLAKVKLGEADAGIVYETDIAVGGVGLVPIPGGLNVETSYFAAVVAGTAQPDQAEAFVSFLSESSAQALLADLGFRP